MSSIDPTIEMLPDRIADMYVGKDILLTGGTGFLGKVLIEKFLRYLQTTLFKKLQRLDVTNQIR